MKIDINLATRRYGRSNIPEILLMLFFVFSALYSVYNFYNYRINRKQLNVYAKMYPAVEIKATAPQKIDANLLGKKVGAINAIIHKETFSWTELLSDLEESVPENVSIVEIAPSFDSGKIVVKGMGRSMGNVLNFVERLGSQKRFDRVFLLKHSGGKEGPGLFFTISAVYQKENGRKEEKREGRI